jgi:hypothetical protein
MGLSLIWRKIMTDNRGFGNVPMNIIDAIDRLVIASSKFAENKNQSLQSHVDAAYDNLLMQIYKITNQTN